MLLQETTLSKKSSRSMNTRLIILESMSDLTTTTMISSTGRAIKLDSFNSIKISLRKLSIESKPESEVMTRKMKKRKKQRRKDFSKTICHFQYSTKEPFKI